MPKISILVVDDHTIVREGLKAFLNTQPDMEVVAEAQDGEEALRLVTKSAPEVVLMDVSMPRMNGLTATRRILRAAPTVRVLVVSSYHDAECVADFLRAGAAGYLPKETAATDLPEAIRQVRRGQTFLAPALDRQMNVSKQRQEHLGSSELTPRENQVLKILVTGLRNTDVAQELGLSIKTIEKHRQSIMNKLNLHDIARLTRYAISKGLVETTLPAPFLS